MCCRNISACSQFDLTNPNKQHDYPQSAKKNKAGTASSANRARGALEADKEAPEKSAYSWLEVMLGRVIGLMDTTMENLHALALVVVSVLGSMA